MLNDRGNAYSSKNEFDKAIADFTDAIRLKPKNAVCYYNRAYTRLIQDKPDKALPDLNEAIRLEPKSSHSYVLRSECHKRIGTDLPAALKDADEAIRLSPKEPGGLCQRADVYLVQREWENALRDYTEAIRISPNHPPGYIGRAKLLAWCPDEKQRDAPQAYKDATRACELTGWKSGPALEAYAGSLAALGDFEAAVKWQKKALEDPSYKRAAGESALKLLEHYEFGA